ncbi:MAG: hypothetical protein H0V97_04150 [Actinobacteria bacterium]|nr:hypothetical protein [Actinomycetota bacterium]
MKRTSDAPVKVSDRTKERVRFAAVLSGRSQADVIDAAVDEYHHPPRRGFCYGFQARPFCALQWRRGQWSLTCSMAKRKL